MTNINNLAQKTNFTAGSDKLDLMPFYLTNTNLPGININHFEVGGRAGAKLNLTGDTVVYNDLSFEMLIDEDFNIYHEFMDKLRDNVSPDNGTFGDLFFDFWIDINNSKGNHLFKIEFTNCRVQSIGDIQLDSQEDTTEFTMSVELKFDTYAVIKDQIIPTLQT